MLVTSIHKTLDELVDLLNQLTDTQYANPCEQLSGATIGAHTRHIVELFQCLENQYLVGIICYDKRERNVQIQTDTNFAITRIEAIQKSLNKFNKLLYLEQVIDGEEIRIESNYKRELLYNLEHCIHHQALIKVVILAMPNIQISENFGVAPSTIDYRKQCVQ